jgi:Holliday junction DNA helicase RuvA
MVLELRDKLPPVSGMATPAVPTLSAMEEDVLSALVNLGYQRATAEKSLASVMKNGVMKHGKTGSFDTMFREALAGLSK